MTHTAAETIRQWGGPVSERSNAAAKDMLDGAWDTGDGTMPTDSGIPTDDQLREQRDIVAKVRRELTAEEDAFETAHTAFRNAHAMRMRRIATLNEEEQDEETKLRLMALARYSGTQDKRPIPGVEVRMTKHLVDAIHPADIHEHGYSLEYAADWAHRTGRDALLKLDRPAFERLVKGLFQVGEVGRNELGWLKIVEVPEARIATDLSAIE